MYVPVMIGWKVTASLGNGDLEGCSYPNGAIHRYGAAVQLDQLLDEGQANSRSFLSTPDGAFDAMESFEHARQLRFGNADTAVFHNEHCVGTIGVDCNLDPAVQREFECIGDEVENDLFPHLAVDVDRLSERRTTHVQSQACSFACRAEI